MNYTNDYLSPLGWLGIQSDGKNLLSVKFKQTGKVTRIECSIIRETVSQLKEYFAGTRTNFELPVLVDGTEFQKGVWKTLSQIPFGKTVSYAELAKKAGYPKAFRAVGTALGKNRIPIVLPCHRVVNTGSGLGGFTGGLHIKKRLLEIETQV